MNRTKIRRIICVKTTLAEDKISPSQTILLLNKNGLEHTVFCFNPATTGRKYNNKIFHSCVTQGETDYQIMRHVLTNMPATDFIYILDRDIVSLRSIYYKKLPLRAYLEIMEDEAAKQNASMFGPSIPSIYSRRLYGHNDVEDKLYSECPIYSFVGFRGWAGNPYESVREFSNREDLAVACVVGKKALLRFNAIRIGTPRIKSLKANPERASLELLMIRQRWPDTFDEKWVTSNFYAENHGERKYVQELSNLKKEEVKTK